VLPGFLAQQTGDASVRIDLGAAGVAAEEP